MPDTQNFFDRLVPTLPDGRITGVYIGLHWTAVIVNVNGEERCGLASSIADHEHHYTNEPPVRDAGTLSERPASELVKLVYSPRPTEVSLGLATINALLPRLPHLWVDLHSKDLLARLGKDNTVVLVGHFPFVPELRPQVGKLWVLEQHPQEDDLPASAAAQVIPQADVLALTAMTLLNRTFDELIALRRPGTPTLVVGPTTPLTPLLFDLGATFLSGSVVERPQAVLRGLMQGANFHQLRQLGVRLVSMMKAP